MNSHRSALVRSIARSGRKRLRRLVLLLVVAIPGAAASQERVRTYPQFPCIQTLQTCIDRSEPGDVIEIATDSPIREFLTLDRSIVLRPAFGFEPTIGDTDRERTLTILAEPEGPDQRVLLQGLRIVNTQIRATVAAFAGHEIAIVDNDIVYDSSNASTAAVDVTLLRTSRLEVNLNRVLTSGAAVRARQFGTTGDFRMVANRIEPLPGATAGIELHGFGGRTVVVLQHNSLLGLGVGIDQTVAGELLAHVYNSTIHGANDHGLEIRVEDAAFANLFLYNNLVTGSTGRGYLVDRATTDVVALQTSHNASFGNAMLDDFSGIVSGVAFRSDPVYSRASTGDLRLRSDSPYVDAGDDSPPVRMAPFDATGAHRYDRVDVGAYEFHERIFGDGFESGGRDVWNP